MRSVARIRKTGVRDGIIQARLLYKYGEVQAMVLKQLYHARGDDGKDYEIHVYAEPASHTNAHIEKLAGIWLADGGELRVLSKRHYEIVATGVKLEAHDRDAI